MVGRNFDPHRPYQNPIKTALLRCRISNSRPSQQLKAGSSPCIRHARGQASQSIALGLGKVIGAIAEEISADKTIGGKASRRVANKPKGVDAFFAELIDNEINDVFEIGVVSGRPDLGRRIGRS
jgi:hypothetical protein